MEKKEEEEEEEEEDEEEETKKKIVFAVFIIQYTVCVCARTLSLYVTLTIHLFMSTIWRLNTSLFL